MKDGTLSFIGSGDLYLDRLAADGSSTGLKKVGNATRFTLKVDAETKELLARGRANYGQTLASTSRITGSTIGLTLNQIDTATLAAIFMGDAVDMDGAGGGVTDEAITARHGKLVELAHRDISAVVVTDATGVTTYDVTDDYLINARLGTIEVVADGAITDGQALLVDYTWAAESGVRITGATKPVVRVSLLLDGKNDYDGEAVIARVWDAHLTPSSEVDFLGEEWAELQFEGKMLTPTGKSWPFEVA